MKGKYKKYKKGGPVNPKKRRASDTTSVKTNVDRDTSFTDAQGLIHRMIDLSLINEADPYASERTEPEFKPRKIYNGEPVDPIFEKLGQSIPQRELGREEANKFVKGINPQVDSLFQTPGALSKYQDMFMDRMERAAVPADTTYYDPDLKATVSAGIYEPLQSNGDYSYFRIDSDNPVSSMSSTSKKPIRPKESMVELPPKLPFGNMDMSKPPALRRVLPEIYGVKLNQQTGEFIYRTSEGEVRKKQGPDNAQFVNQNRAALERMRKNR